MAVITDPFLQSQLEERKRRLEGALVGNPQNASLFQLLEEVDSALDRMEHGSYGICEECHDSIEKDRLLADPLVRLCLDHLTAPQRRRLEEDLELAARVQQKLLPPRPLKAHGWRAHYHYEPLGVVSGDYCDLIASENGPEGLLFLLGDVSGKGVAASLLMTHLHAMFRSLATVGLPLAEMMGRANRLLCESTTAGQFATLVCGRATPSGEVEISSAGHCPVLALRDGEVARFESTGMPLGMFCDGDYPTQQTKLEPGDSLFLFTDGASEARDASGGEYGVDRLANLVSCRHSLAPEALAAACLKELSNFSSGAPKTDDLTLLVLRREN
jgi:sigma-B regulation protein RsbU (phosphoserine phosphatase)